MAAATAQQVEIMMSLVAFAKGQGGLRSKVVVCFFERANLQSLLRVAVGARGNANDTSDGNRRGRGGR